MNKTRVICAYTDCIHNKSKVGNYLCSLDNISLSFYSSSDNVDPGFQMTCDMYEIIGKITRRGKDMEERCTDQCEDCEPLKYIKCHKEGIMR